VSGTDAIHALLAQTRGNPQQWLQLVVFLIILGGSFISWLFKQLAAKAEQKRRMDAAERRRLEALRTGRGLDEADLAAAAPAEVPSAAADRQRELAARRQAQLQELRRRQLERARQGGQPPGQRPSPSTGEPTRQTPLVIIPGSTGPIVVERPGPPPRRSPQPPGPYREAPRHPATVSAPPRPQARPEPRPKRDKASRQRQQPAPPPAAIEREKFIHISEAAPQMEVARSPGPAVAVVVAPRTPEDWRRAILAREILGRPLAERAGDPWETPVL
jgi:hypothetical protein